MNWKLVDKYIKKIVKNGGGKYIGIQYSFGVPLILFDDEIGSTKALKLFSLSIKNVYKKVETCRKIKIKMLENKVWELEKRIVKIETKRGGIK